MKKVNLITPPVPEYNKLEKPFKKILKSKQLVNGKWTEKVEERIKKIHNCKYCVLFSSATIAYMTLLQYCLNKNKFRNIYMQDFTWESTKQITEWLRDVPIEYVDVNIENWIAEEPQVAEDTLFIPNMTFGNTKTFKHKNTIYDSSHCLGNKKVNGRGIGEIISFSPAKTITGCEGGCIITNKKDVYNYCLKLRRYHGRISELNACFLYYNLDNLDKQLSWKDDNDNWYIAELYSCGYKTHNGEIIPNELVFTHEKMNSKKRNQMKNYFDIRLRYKPWDNMNYNSKWIYDHQIVLPCCNRKERDKIIDKLKELIE